MRHLNVFGLVMALVLVVVALEYPSAAEGDPVGGQGGNTGVKKADDVQRRPRMRRPGTARISDEARQAHLKERTERRWKHLDKNGDGILTKDEFGNRQRIFSAMDKDSNGQITRAEHTQSMNERNSRLRRGRRVPPIMRRLDKDQDQRLSKKEAPLLFERSPNPDADDNGYITREELLKVFSGSARRRHRRLPPRQILQEHGSKRGTVTPDR